jgi:hypothetical protein
MKGTFQPLLLFNSVTPQPGVLPSEPQQPNGPYPEPDQSSARATVSRHEASLAVCIQANSESEMISNQTVNPVIYVNGLRKTTARFGQDSLYLGRNWNQAPTEYDIPISRQGKSRDFTSALPYTSTSQHFELCVMSSFGGGGGGTTKPRNRPWGPIGLLDN